MATKKIRKKARRRASLPKPGASGREGASGGGAAGGHSIPSPRSGSSWRKRVLRESLAALALCLLVAACYFPVTSAEFLWDDAAFTMAEPVQTLSGIWQIWFEPSSLEKREGHYWPLLYTTFWLEHKLWGFNPLGYHLINLLLHAGVTLLLWHVMRRLTVPGAWVAAAIFAVHPLHVESVAWVIGRKDMLSTLFYLGSALAYMRFVERRHWQQYAWAFGLLLAGLLCKSMPVTLPAALLLWHWWRDRRVTADDVVRVTPLLLLGVVVTVVDWSFYKSREVISFDFSLPERMLLAARALGFYVGKLAWPTELSVIYSRWDVGIGDWVAWGCAVAIVTVVGLLWRYQRQVGRGPLAGLLFFAVTLSPTLGFVDYGYMQFAFVADRYQYLGGIGVIAVVVGAVAVGVRRLASACGAGIPVAASAAVTSADAASADAASGAAVGASAWSRLAGARGTGLQLIASATLAMLATLAVVPLGMITWKQASLYDNAGRLFNHIIAFNPEARGAQHNLGDWLYKEERFEDALVAYQIAVEQRPDFAPLRNQMGITLDKLRQYENAEEQYRVSLKINPRFIHGMNNLASVLARQQQYPEALEYYKKVLAMDATYVNSHLGMGFVLAKLNRLEEALRSFERALELDPSRTEARTNRDFILEKLGRTAE